MKPFNFNDYLKNNLLFEDNLGEAMQKFKPSDITKGDKITFYYEKEDRLVVAEVLSVTGDKIRVVHHAEHGYESSRKYVVDISYVLKVRKKR